MQVRERVEKSRSTVCWQWSVAQEGRKVDSLHDTDTNDTHYTIWHYTTPHSTTTATTTTTTTTVRYSTRHYTNAMTLCDTTPRQHATVQDTTVRDMTAHCTHDTAPKRLQLHHTNYTTAQVQLHYTTTIASAARHDTTSSSCGWSDHCNRCNHSKKHKSNPSSLTRLPRCGLG